VTTWHQALARVQRIVETKPSPLSLPRSPPTMPSTYKALGEPDQWDFSRPATPASCPWTPLSAPPLWHPLSHHYTVGDSKEPKLYHRWLKRPSSTEKPILVSTQGILGFLLDFLAPSVAYPELSGVTLGHWDR
jgi:hypothetical protein